MSNKLKTKRLKNKIVDIFPYGKVITPIINKKPKPIVIKELICSNCDHSFNYHKDDWRFNTEVGIEEMYEYCTVGNCNCDRFVLKK